MTLKLSAGMLYVLYMAANFAVGSNFDKCHLSGTFLSMILQNFKKIAQRAAELYAIQLSLYLPLNLHCQQHSVVMQPICRHMMTAWFIMLTAFYWLLIWQGIMYANV